jgi:hypothetical protein
MKGDYEVIFRATLERCNGNMLIPQEIPCAMAGNLMAFSFSPDTENLKVILLWC